MGVRSKLDDNYRWLSSSGKYGQQALLRTSDAIVGLASSGKQVLNNITSKIVNISRSQRVFYCWRLELKQIQSVTVVLDF